MTKAVTAQFPRQLLVPNSPIRRGQAPLWLEQAHAAPAPTTLRGSRSLLTLHGCNGPLAPVQGAA